MGKLIWNDEEYTLDKYIKYKILANLGSQSYATKEQLKKQCMDKGLIISGKESKEEYYDLLVEHGWTAADFESVYGIGISSQDYQREFNITHEDIKRLEKFEALNVVGEYRFRAYGNYHYAPLYSVSQFVKMTEDDMRELLSKYPKGSRKKKD